MAPFETFLALRAERQAGEKKDAAVSLPQRESRQKNKLRKLSFKEQRELEQLTTKIDELESQQTDLQSQINGSGDDYLRMQSLAVQLETVDSELDVATERWLELEEIAEAGRSR